MIGCALVIFFKPASMPSRFVLSKLIGTSTTASTVSTIQGEDFLAVFLARAEVDVQHLGASLDLLDRQVLEELGIPLSQSGFHFLGYDVNILANDVHGVTLS